MKDINEKKNKLILLNNEVTHTNEEYNKSIFVIQEIKESFDRDRLNKCEEKAKKCMEVIEGGYNRYKTYYENKFESDMKKDLDNMADAIDTDINTLNNYKSHLETKEIIKNNIDGNPNSSDNDKKDALDEYGAAQEKVKLSENCLDESKEQRKRMIVLQEKRRRNFKRNIRNVEKANEAVEVASREYNNRLTSSKIYNDAVADSNTKKISMNLALFIRDCANNDIIVKEAVVLKTKKLVDSEMEIISNIEREVDLRIKEGEDNDKQLGNDVVDNMEIFDGRNDVESCPTDLNKG